jgi:hypothetical protein
MLLYFYQLQRTAPLTMPYRQIGFVTKKEGGVGVTSDKKWLTKDLLSINPGSNDIFNAFLFLMKKNFTIPFLSSCLRSCASMGLVERFIVV